MSKVESVPIGKLVESPLNPRKHYDKKGLDELAASMKEVGQLVPLLARVIDGKFEIASGHRRLRAAKLAGLKTLDVIAEKMLDQDFLQILTIENLEREDVHPLDEAQGYKTYMAQMKCDVKTLTQKLGKGKSVSYVYQRLKLLDLIPRLQDLFLNGKISAGQAILIARLTPENQGDVLKRFDLVDRNEDSVRGLSRYIQARFHQALSKAPFKLDDPNVLKSAGPCTTCPKRTGNKSELFPEIQDKDTCTDPTCFRAKMSAFVEGKRQAVKERGGKSVDITEDWYTGGKGVLNTKQYEIATSKCKDPVTGIVVEGPNIGKTKQICRDKDCKAHGKERASRSSGHTRKDQARIRRKLARTRKVRLQAIDEIRKNVTGSTGVDELKLFAVQMVAGLQQDEQRALFTIETGKKTDRLNFDRSVFKKLVDPMSPPQLHRFLVTAYCVDSLVGGEYSMPHNGGRLMEMAKRFKVNVTKIENQIKKEERKK